MNVATVKAAAASNHLSCMRSSPVDRLKRTISPVRPTTGGTVRPRKNMTFAAAPVTCRPNGSDQLRVADAIANAVATAYAPAMSQAAGRHRGEGSRPVGNSNKKNANAGSVTSQIHTESQANARPAGNDPGAATRACSPYWALKLSSPRFAARVSQPIGFSGRLDATTKPRTIPARIVTSVNTDPG